MPYPTREIMARSRTRYEAQIGADWRYPGMFDFLEVSPSYRLAHLLATGEVRRGSIQLPADFDAVEKTYRAFGDVSQTYFWAWWISIAQYQFGVAIPPEPRGLLKLIGGQQPSEQAIGAAKDALLDYLSVDRPAQGQPATMVVALPVLGDRAALFRSLETMLNAAYGSARQPVGVAPFTIIRNKIRKSTVTMARQVLRARAARPKARLFVIGNLTNVSRAHWTNEEQPRREQGDKRRIMEIMVSRHLHRAYLLAEHAARGQFPSLDPLPDDLHRPNFDFNELKQVYRRHIRWMNAELRDMRALHASMIARGER